MSNKRVFSVLGLFDSAPLLMQAIPEVKAKVAARLEAYSPFPIHGIDKALGLRKSPIAGMVLIMGIIGAIAAIGFAIVDQRSRLSADDGRETLFLLGSIYPDHLRTDGFVCLLHRRSGHAPAAEPPPLFPPPDAAIKVHGSHHARQVRPGRRIRAETLLTWTPLHRY